MPCFLIGLPLPRFDLLTHHIASCALFIGLTMPDLGLFGERVHGAPVASNARQPSVPLRVMIALL